MREDLAGELPVVIAGAGPAGLCLAVLLAQRGIAVRVFEERTEPENHSRAIGLHPPALDVLDLAGVGKQAVAEGVAIRDGVALADGRPVASLDFGVLTGRHRYVLALPQSRTVELLAARLAEIAPDALLRGRRVNAFRDHGADIEVDHGRVPEPGDNGGDVPVPQASGVPDRRTLSARWLVGADGTRSAVRTAAGLPFRGRPHPDHYAMGDFPDGSDFGSTAALFLHPAGIVESFPLPGGARRWVVRLRAAGAPASSSGRAAWLAREVLVRTGHRIDPAGCTMTSWFGTRRRRVPAMVSGRAVLIGDAAHEISPIGGQGMTLGLQDAAALAPLLEAAVPDTGALSALSRQRLAAAGTAGRQAHLNMVLGRPLPPAVLAGRNGLLRAALSIPRSRALVARRFTMDF